MCEEHHNPPTGSPPPPPDFFSGGRRSFHLTAYGNTRRVAACCSAGPLPAECPGRRAQNTPHPLLRMRAPSPQSAERLEFEARKEEMKARAMRASGLFKFTG